MASRRNKGGKPPEPPVTPRTKADTDPERAAARRVAVLRNKLTDAMTDPTMRAEIVRAIRAMMKQE